MPGIETLSDKLISAIVTGVIGFLFWAIQRRLEPGAKLGWWIPHDFLFSLPIPPNPLRIQTSTLTVQNLGRKAAEDVQIMHQTKVDHFQLHPRRDYAETVAADGTHTINVGSLGAKEWLQLQVLSHATPPVLVGIRSKDGPAKNVRFHIVRKFPKPVEVLLGVSALLGGFAILYWIVRAVLFISRANGML
ncbi:hypothetical protein ACPUER_34740 [Burkholderia sp. DN3021]|uniref:hypothetical protein n=1 Tax=Burkholderia sp. DN3021 TaxID=3410137 RepID=UPI003C7EA74D